MSKAKILKPMRAVNDVRALFGGISRTAVYDLVDKGILPEPYQVGGRSLWDDDDIAAAMAALPKGRRAQRNRRMETT